MTQEQMLKEGIVVEIVLKGDNLEEKAEELIQQIRKEKRKDFFRGFYHSVKIIE